MLSAAAKSAARRRDKQRGVFKPVASATAPIKTPKTAKTNSRRASLTGGFLRSILQRTTHRRNGPPDDSEPSGSENNDGTDDESDGEQPHVPAYEHGHRRKRELWSKELDEINAPELTEAEPEDILDFQILWEEYADKVNNVAQKHNTVIDVKPIYDCIEKHNR